MRRSYIKKSTRYLWRLTALSLAVQLILSVLVLNGYSQPGGNEREGRRKLKTATSKPKNTRGAPYPAAKPSDQIPNPEPKPAFVPTGPKQGDMKPSNPAIRIKQITTRDGKSPDGTTESNNLVSFLKSSYEPKSDGDALFPQPRPLFFRGYTELTNFTSTSGCCPEISAGENGQTVMMTANTWMALSEDGGATFAQINPTTIFPQSDGGFCCDQVVVYIPQIDMFVWLLQYRGAKNRIRIAAQTTSQVRSSNGLAWTYWDFVSDTFDTGSALDYNDVGFGRTNLWWTSQNGTGRVVVRVPLAEIAAKTTIHFQFTGGTDALWSHLTQNATNRVFWAGHINNSQMRVFDMRDGDGFYSWRTVNINSWPNETNTAKCPDSDTDWMGFESWKHYVFGNALQRGNVWFSWLASSGGGFPMPHVQMVRINPATWTLQEQVQIWNPTIAFQDAYLSTNNQGELGMEIAFGSGGFFPSSAVGVWGDFVVYYPRLSTRCVAGTSSQRWGDYNHSRRATVNGAEWIAGGYTNEKNSSGGNIVIPHYIRFGR